MRSTSYNMKCDRSLAKISKWSDTHCEIKETMLIGDLGLSENVSTEKLYLFQSPYFTYMQILLHYVIVYYFFN